MRARLRRAADAVPRLADTRRRRSLAAAIAVICLGLASLSAWVSGRTGAYATGGGPGLTRAELPTTTTLPPPPPPPPTTTVPPPPADNPVPVVKAAAKPASIPKDPYAVEPVRQIGSMEIPKLGVVTPIFEGATLNNIDHGPSHWPGTAMPGQPGNTVFAGHRVTHTHPFRDIDQLVPGDVVTFTVDGVRSTYQVTGHEIVTPKDTWIADQTAAATGTLYACHPPHSATYRYVVRLALVPSG